MKSMTTLAVLDLFRTQYMLEPDETQSLTALMSLAWTPKLFYGIISDTFPLFGTRKKSYLALMGLLQFCTAFTLAIYPFESAVSVAGLCFVMNLASAFMDVVVDGLMVMQSRKDAANGSQNLQTFSWQMLGIGGIIGGITGGLFTQYLDTHYCFYIFGLMGFFIMLSAIAMPDSIEAEQLAVINMSLCNRVSTNFNEIKTGFKVRELRRAVVFFILLGCLVPTFGDFFYYYQLEVVGFSKLTYALVGSLGFFYLIVAMQLYNTYLKEKETTIMMVIACFTNLLGSIGCILFVREIYFGLDPLAFMLLTSTVTDLLQDAFQRLPGMVLFAKMIPSNIESSMFAMLTGLMNLSNGFTSKMLGNLLNRFVGVHETNLTDLWVLYVIQAGCALLPLAFIWLIPNKEEVEGVQRAIEFIEKNEASPYYEEDKSYLSDSESEGKSVNAHSVRSSGATHLDAATLAVLQRIRPHMYKKVLDERVIKAERYLEDTTACATAIGGSPHDLMSRNAREFLGISQRSRASARSK